MENTNTRRGFTQNVVNKNCHSRGIGGPQGSGISLIRNRKQAENFCLKTTLQKEDPRQKPSGMTPLYNNGGFTLIELLVVVLIIGILAAVAVPQYQKAVEKSRAAQGITLVKSLAQAAQAYYLANGTYATSTDQLDVSLSEAQKEEFYCNSIYDECNKKEWGIDVFWNAIQDHGIIGWRTSGKYKGGGFVIYQNVSNSSLQPNTLYCYERYAGPNAIETKGSYCQKLFNGTYITLSSNAYLYTLL